MLKVLKHLRMSEKSIIFARSLGEGLCVHACAYNKKGEDLSSSPFSYLVSLLEQFTNFAHAVADRTLIEVFSELPIPIVVIVG